MIGNVTDSDVRSSATSVLDNLKDIDFEAIPNAIPIEVSGHAKEVADLLGVQPKIPTRPILDAMREQIEGILKEKDPVTLFRKAMSQNNSPLNRGIDLLNHPGLNPDWAGDTNAWVADDLPLLTNRFVNTTLANSLSGDNITLTKAELGGLATYGMHLIGIPAIPAAIGSLVAQSPRAVTNIVANTNLMSEATAGLVKKVMSNPKAMATISSAFSQAGTQAIAQNLPDLSAPATQPKEDVGEGE